jgi:hypothetical protein
VDAGDRNRIVRNVFTDVLRNHPAYSLSAVHLEDADGRDATQTLGMARQNLVAHNLFLGSFSHGWRVYADLPVPARDNVVSNRIANNIFCSALSSGTVSMVSLAPEVDHALNRYDHNLYFASGAAGMAFRHEGAVYTSLPAFRAAAGQETNSVAVDPRWVSPAAKDFRLRPSSPCLDAGAAIPGVNDGSRGKAPDIGPFEFDGSSVVIDLSRTTNGTVVSWEALSNAVYQLQATSTLTETDWSDVGGAVTALTANMHVEDPDTTLSLRCYRVNLVQWP